MQATARRLLLPWLLLLIPLALIDMQYPRLPAQLPVLRDWAGSVQVWAPKTFLTAFRVPFMGMLMAAMVSLLWWQARQDPNAARRDASAAFWFVLLCAAALKSFCEGLEFVIGLSGPAYSNVARWCWLGTLVAIGGGLALAALPGWRWLHSAKPAIRPLPPGTKLGLLMLVALYAGLAFAPRFFA